MRKGKRETRWAGKVLALVVFIAAGLASTAVQAAQEIILRVGESKTIYLGKIKNVEVGNPSVVDVQTHPDGDKIVVFGVRPGYSSLVVGTIAYDVNVVGDIERLRKDVETLLLDIPGVDVLSTGDRVVIDGVVKRRDDMERIKAIVLANPTQVYALALLDERDIVKKAQVQLHFQVLEVNKTRDHDIGIDWSGGPIRLVMDTMSYIQFGPGNITDSVGTVRRPDDLLDFTSRADIRRVLDKDFFTTISGETVEFFRGKELIFRVAGTGGGLGQLIIKKVGLDVKSTPVIDDDGDIDLQIDVKFSTVGELVFGGDVPAINTQEHKAHVQLKEGESFALSGFFRREKGRTITGLPGLKDIPGLGVLFGSRHWEKGETDGIIVITPVLLDPDRRTMRKQIKETLDIYDASDVKF
jgi:pilus assembly protein CpaC